MKKYITIALAIFSLLILSCKTKRDNSAPLAQVNDDILTETAFNSMFSAAELDTLSASVKRKYIEDWVNMTLLAQAADKSELLESAGMQARLDYAAKKVKSNFMIGQRLAGIRVSEDELFSYFRVHRADFENNLKEYSIQRIKLSDKATAELLLSRIESGLEFNEAVRTYSVEQLPSGDGLMGWVTRTSADSTWWNAALGLPLAVPAVSQQSGSWYVFRIVEERDSSEEANFEDYREEIRSRIIAQREEQVYQDLVRELKAQTNKIYYY